MVLWGDSAGGHLALLAAPTGTAVAGGTVSLMLVPGASHFWDGADDVPGIVARSADFARSLAPLEV